MEHKSNYLSRIKSHFNDISLNMSRKGKWQCDNVLYISRNNIINYLESVTPSKNTAVLDSKTTVTCIEKIDAK
jgi:hypothetical protein